MVMTCQGQCKGDVTTINVGAQRDEGKEVTVRHEIISLKWKTWSYEHVSREWKKTL